jgi:predicted dehydrogenase
MMIDDDHLNHLLYSEKGVAHAYIPGHSEDMVFLGSTTPGDWAAGDFWGPMANETRAWLDHLATGSATVQTTPQQARLNLEVTLAIVRAVQTGKPVTLPFSG